MFSTVMVRKNDFVALLCFAMIFFENYIYVISYSSILLNLLAHSDFLLHFVNKDTLLCVVSFLTNHLHFYELVIEL